MLRFISLVNAGALLALAQLPSALWPQIAIVPPGTNPGQRVEAMPGVPGGGVVPTAVIGIPTQTPQQGSAPTDAPNRVLPPGVQSIVMGAAAASRNAAGSRAATAAPGLPLAAAACEVHVASSRISVEPNGGIVEVPVAPLPPQCPAPAFGATGTWLQLTAGPQTPHRYRFSAAPNTTAARRTANILIGHQVVLVEQDGVITTRLAAAPAKVAIGLSPKYSEHRRQITLWADKAGTTLTVVSNAPWLRVEAAKSRNADARTFTVIVESAKLPATGVRHEGAVVVSASGAPSLSVPVVVERISRR